jgi:hypothetical protein
MAALKASLAAAGGDAPEAAGGDKAKGDDQLSIEQGRLRGVKGGGEGRKSSSSSSSKSKAKTPAKKPANQRRRKAS